MSKFVFFLALVATATAGPLSLRMSAMSPTGRIVGGNAIHIEEVPWQIVFSILGNRRCGGSIISENWVLTAGHCLVFPANWYAIRAGSTLASSQGSSHLVETLITHADFFEDSFGIPHFDVGLVRVKTPFIFDSTRAAVPLFNAGEKAVAGTSALVTGWGFLKESGPWTETLQGVKIAIVSKDECDLAYTKYGGVPAGQICAGNSAGAKDACGGDSGGPLVIEGRLAGIVSWGNGCARPGYFGVYTEIASYRDWITEKSGV